MLTNYHTHSTYCDGKSAPEEVVLSALNKGFAAIGFSGHAGFVAGGKTYRKTNIGGYIREIHRLQEKYKQDIQIYCGIEEDHFAQVERQRFRYMIGSVHYMYKDGKYLSIDGGETYFQECITAFGGDPLVFAEAYFREFCEYIGKRKPDIIGHFDLITKFEEKMPVGLMENETYCAMAERYITEAAKSGCIFEVNTGAISRGWRTAPYPQENLLHVLKKLDAPIILNADSHHADTIDCHFAEARALLRDVGIRETVVLYNDAFQKVSL